MCTAGAGVRALRRLPPCAGPTGRPARNPLATLAAHALALAAAHGAVLRRPGRRRRASARAREVTRAFRALAREHHPDKVRDVVRASKAGGSRQRARASSGRSLVSAARACAGSDSHTPAGAPLVARTSRDLCARGCFAPSHAGPRACCRRAVTPTASSRFVQPMRAHRAPPTGKARVEMAAGDFGSSGWGDFGNFWHAEERVNGGVKMRVKLRFLGGTPRCQRRLRLRRAVI